jgi:hypothetical protein
MGEEVSPRFGIAEWFGRRVQDLSEEERRQFAEEARKSSPALPCIPRNHRMDGETQTCTKEGGVCSIRLYELAREDKGTPDDEKTHEEASEVSRALPAGGPVVTLCPHRFKEQNRIYQWAGEEILQDVDPEFVREVPFLERDRHPDYDAIWGRSSSRSSEDKSEEDSGDDDVGRIDGILISATIEEVDERRESSKPSTEHLEGEYEFDLSIHLDDWCGLEIQSVYFSGDKMSIEYPPFEEVAPPYAPFPQGRRRPDFRSSSAKRLLPQLQTKIPSLRRWGKKMAVVVDEAFFYEMAEMKEVDHISNCDIVWIVVGYEREGQSLQLRRKRVCLTTLEDAVLGLTAGKPVAQEEFEDRIAAKLKAPYAKDHIEALERELGRLMLRRSGLETSVRQYIDRMEKIRSNRAEQNKRLKSAESSAEKARLEESIEMQDRQIASLWNRRRAVEEKEERLKERCKAIRSVRAGLNEEID